MTAYLHSFVHLLQTGGWLMLPLALDAVAIAFVFLNARRASDATARRDQLKLLTALVATAPLLGLLGTVVGIIDTFASLSAYSQLQQPALVADGIAKALVTTQTGLAIAIPGAFCRLALQRSPQP